MEPVPLNNCFAFEVVAVAVHILYHLNVASKGSASAIARRRFSASPFGVPKEGKSAPVAEATYGLSDIEEFHYSGLPHRFPLVPYCVLRVPAHLHPQFCSRSLYDKTFTTLLRIHTLSQSAKVRSQMS